MAGDLINRQEASLVVRECSSTPGAAAPRRRITETKDYSLNLCGCWAEGLTSIAKEAYLLKDAVSELWSGERLCYLPHKRSTSGG